MLVTLLRTILIYLVVVLGLRMMGKRQLGELQPSELVVTILVSDIATLPIEDTGLSLLSGAIPILTLVCFEVLFSYLSLKSQTLRRCISGTPRILIRDGVIDQREMRTLRYSVDDLMELLRSCDIFDLQDVAYAIVETNGKLNVCPKADCQPLTFKQLQQQKTPQDKELFPVLVISDGHLMAKGISFCGGTPQWVEQQAAQQGFCVKDVFLMTCTAKKEIYLVPKAKEKGAKP